MITAERKLPGRGRRPWKRENRIGLFWRSRAANVMVSQTEGYVRRRSTVGTAIVESRLDLGAVILDVTGLPDSGSRNYLTGPQNIFVYAHSNGRPLLFSTVSVPFAHVYDLDHIVAENPDPGLIQAASLFLTRSEKETAFVHGFLLPSLLLRSPSLFRLKLHQTPIDLPFETVAPFSGLNRA